jgi:HEAT repeat protein
MSEEAMASKVWRAGWAAAVLLLGAGAGPVRATPAAWPLVLPAVSFWDEADDPDDDEKPGQRIEELYDEGTDALDEERWDDAVAAFDEVSRMGGDRADGALYWKSYALAKSGHKAEALSAVAELRRKAPKSRWLKEAQALEMEIRQVGGEPVSPEAEPDEDLKLIALNALLAADSSKAVPMLDGLLSSGSSRKLRDRALFVLTQSGSPQARAIVADVARGRRQPELQRTAIKYLGLFGGKESRQELSEIYAAAEEQGVKQAVLQAFMVAGDKERVLAAARGEKSPQLRRAAIQLLGAMGAQEELWQLYRDESSLDVKKNILHGMFIGGGDQRLIDLARTETDPELRRAVVRNLGLLGSSRTGPTLVSLYRGDPDLGIRREAVQGLFIQGNAAALVQLARDEKDPALRKELVSRLSLMNSKEAVDYLMELLK